MAKVGQEQAMDKGRTGVIDGIQVLRAIAAIMVVFHHARLSIPYGDERLPSFLASGVDIFFIISGFVMALTTPQRAKAPSDAWLFLRKRIARIVPLYWIILIWTARRGPFNLGLLKDFFFVPRWNDTYANSIEPVVIQGWTLNYEMFFYVLFAVSMMFGGRRLIVLSSFLILLALIGLAPKGGIVQQFYTNEIILEFGFGALLQRIVSGFYPHWPRAILVVIMAAGFGFLAFGFDRQPRALWEGLPAVLIVWAGLGAFEGSLKSSALRILGDASYSIYLFHWASFGALKPLVIEGTPLLYPLMILHVVFATIIGVLVHIVIEKPLMGIAKQFLRIAPSVRLIPPSEARSDRCDPMPDQRPASEAR